MGEKREALVVISRDGSEEENQNALAYDGEVFNIRIITNELFMIDYFQHWVAEDMLISINGEATCMVGVPVLDPKKPMLTVSAAPYFFGGSQEMKLIGALDVPVREPCVLDHESRIDGKEEEFMVPFGQPSSFQDQCDALNMAKEVFAELDDCEPLLRSSQAIRLHDR
jgi:hypothetical protein